MSATFQADSFPPSHFARKHSVSPETIARWCSRGKLMSDGSRLRLAHFRLPKGIRISQAAVDAFLEAIGSDRAGNTPASTKSWMSAEDERQHARNEWERAEMKRLGY
jgi:hypothetical protein